MTYPIRRHIRQPVRRSRSWESTDLGLIEDGHEDDRSAVSNKPRYDSQQRAYSVQRRRFDEHGDDGLVQSTHSGCTPHGGTNVPDVHDESDDDHDGEENVKRN